MDGPTSRLPSTSIASITSTNPELAHVVTARRSVKEAFSSAPVTPNASYVDPPRPAKEGHEWVWFPAGYWAERAIVESPGRSIKTFKWRKRSGKNSSDKDTQDSQGQSPKYPSDQWLQTLAPLASPYLTEEAHVRSLQTPSIRRHGTSSESASSFPLNRPPQPPMPSPYLTGQTHVQSLQRTSLHNHSPGSESGTSLRKYTKPLASSPLMFGQEDSDPTTPAVSVAGRPAIPRSISGVREQEVKPKKSLLSRLLQNSRPPLPGFRIFTECAHADERVWEQKPKKARSSDADYTTNTLAGVCTQLSLNRTASLLRGDGRRPQKSWSLRLLGKSPWYRKASAGSEVSASSSLRDVLRGRTPVTSPVSDLGAYFDPSSSSYSSNFPGGEATRVKTPPLRERGNAGRPRSFFFDISPPTPSTGTLSSSQNKYSNTTTTTTNNSTGNGNGKNSGLPPLDFECPSPSPSPPQPKHQQQRAKRAKRESAYKEWWEVPVAVPRYTDMAPAAFEFDIPEHLPSSPMCPANKRHKSGGTGVCVYHGRRKKSSGDGDGSEAERERSDDYEDVEDVWT
ncbi:hypothetical protein F5B20DRAFT_595417 [Whalleya microplaca]|nr:hypothetical protein F5B20DRAFT_595417 [Whalleya microplaca]